SRTGSDRDFGLAEAGGGGGTRPQADAAIGIGDIGNGVDRLAIYPRRNRGPVNVEPQRVPFIAVRAKQLLAQVTAFAMNVSIEPQHVVQGALLQHIKVLRISDTEGDARIHLGSLA